jgi:2-iminobutanoate/2-iminopropanoate deaminase
MKKVFALLVIGSVVGLSLPHTAKAQNVTAPAVKPSKQGSTASKKKSPTLQVRYLNSPKPRPLPFSDAVRVGDMLYLSGQIGSDANLKIVPGGIQVETRQALDNIRTVLERNGSSLDHVVKCTVMLADMAEWSAMNEIYATYFAPDRLPARSSFGATALALGAHVEIECMAVAQ